jgi:hypothetical protein
LTHGLLPYMAACVAAANDIQVGNKKLAYVVQWATQAQARAACRQRGGKVRSPLAYLSSTVRYCISCHATIAHYIR